MPDGKLHVLNTQAATAVQSTAQAGAVNAAVTGNRLTLVTAASPTVTNTQQVTVVKTPGQVAKPVVRQIRPGTPIKNNSTPVKPTQVCVCIICIPFR